MSHKEAVIYDLEYTTWPGTLERNWSGENEHREIIRIGAISIDLDNLQEIEAMDVFVKPSVNPILSDYCAKLTDITDEQIQIEGIELHEALHKFVNFVGKRNIFCHGSDIVVILENLKLNNIAFNARTLQSDRPIVINEYNQTDFCLESNVVEITLYGLTRFSAPEEMFEGFCVDLKLHGNCVQLMATDLNPWFHEKAPETQGIFSGEIAKALGVSELNGDIHNPLFDVRSIHMGLRELILSRHIENPLK